MSDLDYFDRVQAASDPTWASRSESEATGVEEPPATVPVEPADDWEPLEPLSLDERVDLIASYLGPRALEEQRQEQLAAFERRAEQFHDMPPRELAAQVADATRQVVMDELGVAPRAATMNEILAEGEEIAAHHLGERWPELRDAVFAEMQERPQWLHAVNPDPSSAVLGQTFVTIAATLAAAESARSAAGETRRAAQTMGGGSVRPPTLTGDEAYWDKIRAAGGGGYGT